MLDRWPDTKAAFRGIWRRPGGVAAAVVSLAAGIGLNVAVLALLREVFWAPLPYRQEERLVTIVASAPGTAPRSFLTGTESMAFRRLEAAFEDAATIERWPATRRAWTDLQRSGHSIRVAAAFATPNLFDLLGVAGIRGRGFVAGDAGAPVGPAVLSDRLWQREFGAHPAAVNSPIKVGGTWYTVVGVLPRHFVSPVPSLGGVLGHLDEIDVWVLQDPAQIAGQETDALQYNFVGRLRDGIELRQVNALVRTVGEGLPTQRRTTVDYVVEPLRSAMIGAAAPRFRLLVFLSALLLAAALSNLLTVLSLRMVDHQRELFIRVAVGASGSNLWTVPLTETVTLATAGGLFGAAVALFADRLLRRSLPAVRWTSTDTAAGEVAVLSVLLVVLCAILASWFVLRDQKRLLLSSRSSAALDTRSSSALRKRILVAQLATMVILAAPSLGLWRGIGSVKASSPVLVRGDLLAAETWLLPRLVEDSAAVLRMQDSLKQRLLAIPGVTNVGMGLEVPLLGVKEPTRVVSVSHGSRPRHLFVFGETVDRDYFDVLNAPLVSGRLFSDGDTEKSPPVAVVSESLARLAFGGESALGRRLEWHGSREVVGVVADSLRGAPDGRARATLYVPRLQDPVVRLAFFLKLAEPRLAPTVMRRVASVHPDQPFDRILPLRTVADVALREQRVYAGGAALLAGNGLFLGMLGLYIVANYTLSIRRKELAIRAALGAGRSRITGLIVREYWVLLGLTLLIAVVPALWLLRAVAQALAPLPVDAPSVIGSVAVAFVVLCTVLVGSMAWFRTGFVPVDELRQQE